MSLPPLKGGRHLIKVSLKEDTDTSEVWPQPREGTWTRERFTLRKGMLAKDPQGPAWPMPISGLARKCGTAQHR